RVRWHTTDDVDTQRQREIDCNNRLFYYGLSGTPSGSVITAATFDSGMVRRTCTATVAKDQTWSCAQTLGDGGYTWTAQVAASGPASQQVDFVVNTRGYPAPTIDHTPSPNSDAKPILTGTVSASLTNKSFHLEVTENGKAICIVSPIKSTNWACALADKLGDGPHVLSVDVDFSNGDEATPSGNANAFVVKTSISKPTLAPVPTPTSSASILFSGTGEPAAVVTLARGSAVLCQSAVSAGGAWSCMPPSPLPDGEHTVSATQQDAAGNVSAPRRPPDHLRGLGRGGRAGLPHRQLFAAALLGGRERSGSLELRAGVRRRRWRLSVERIPGDAGGKPQRSIRCGATRRAHAADAVVRRSVVADARCLAAPHRPCPGGIPRLRVPRRDGGL